MLISIFTPSISPRIKYITDFVFRQRLGIKVELIDQPAQFKQKTTIKICYSRQALFQDGLWMPLHPIMLETDIRPQAITLFHIDNIPAFFQIQKNAKPYSCDILAMIFYLLTRYEEYLPYQGDVHGRFPASQSLAGCHHFLHRPVIDIWIHQMAEILRRMDSRFSAPSPIYRFLPTFDIDMAWLFRHKGSIRNTGAALKELASGRVNDLMKRLSVLAGFSPDPFDHFDYLDQLIKKHQLNPIFFLLLGKFGRFDKNVSPRQPAMQRLIRRLARHYQLGLHPSYQSNEQCKLIKKEKQQLETISGASVALSRQHFVRLTFPHTYRQLLDVGITDDYSMGYPEQPGFRAGTSSPFYWYDLAKNCPTRLRVHPFQLMDVTLQQYLQLAPEESIALAKQLAGEVKKYGGQFVSIWHNSSLSDEGEWKGWRRVHEQLIQLAVG